MHWLMRQSPCCFFCSSEEALADADDAWEEASAAADEAVAAGDMSSDSLPAYTEAQEKPEGGDRSD